MNTQHTQPENWEDLSESEQDIWMKQNANTRDVHNETRKVLDLSRPIRSERRRGFQPPWYTVYIYRCANGHEICVRANSFRGRNPVPGIGGIYCPQCNS